MTAISAQVLGAEKVAARFSNDAAQAIPRVQAAVQRLGLEVLRRAKEKVSGEVLNVRTGRGRRSLNEETEVSGNTVTSTTGTNVDYMAMWERGFSRPVGPGSRGGKVLAAHKRGAISIKTFAPRSFLVSTLEELRPRIAEQLAKAVL